MKNTGELLVARARRAEEKGQAEKAAKLMAKAQRWLEKRIEPWAAPDDFRDLFEIRISREATQVHTSHFGARGMLSSTYHFMIIDRTNARTLHDGGAASVKHANKLADQWIDKRFRDGQRRRFDEVA